MSRLLTDDEAASFKWRHPLLAMDLLFDTWVDGESVQDDTLGGYVVIKAGNGGIPYLVFTTDNPGTVSLWDILSGSSLGKGIGSAIGTIELLLILAIVVYLLFLFGKRR